MPFKGEMQTANVPLKNRGQVVKFAVFHEKPVAKSLICKKKILKNSNAAAFWDKHGHTDYQKFDYYVHFSL